MTFGLRLVCYDVDGPRRGAARGMLIERYARAGEPGRLRVGFSELAPRGELFAAPVEVAVEYLDADGMTWVEPEDGRYYTAQDQSERTADPTGTHDMTLLGIAQRLNGPRVFQAPTEADRSEDGKRQFSTKSAGQIMGTLLAEAQARGAIPGITMGFSATHDSRGNVWTVGYTRAYELSHSLLGILQSLDVDYWWEGRELNIVPVGTRGRDLSTGNDPVYLRDQYVEASPERDDWTRLADSVLLIGDKGKTWTKTNPEAYAPFGRQEVVIQAGGVTDDGVANVMMDRALAEGADVARQITREWVWLPSVRWMPDRDIRIGDWVLADTAAGARQRVRVADLMCRQSTDGVEAFVTLGTISDDMLTRLARRQIGIEGSAGVGSIGRPTLPDESVGQWPAAPTGLVVSTSTTILSNGYTMGLISGSWVAVTEDINGDPISVDFYHLRARQVSSGAVFSVYKGPATTGSGSDLHYSVGSTWDVDVAAVHVDGLAQWEGPYSDPVRVTVQPDLIPPPVPAAPTVTSSAGALTITTSGLSQGGGGMPPDLWRYLVYITGQADPYPMDKVTQTLSLFAPDVVIGTAYEVRISAQDYSENESGKSNPAAPVTVKGYLEEFNLAAKIADIEADFAAADADLQDQIESIQISASGGNVTYAGPTTPAVPSGGHKAGDLWIDTTSKTIKRWSGSAWVVHQLGNDALADIAAAKLMGQIGTTQIADNAISTPKMQAGSITAASGIIASATIGTAQIIDAAVTNAKIVTLDAAKINTGYLDSARIKTDAAWVTNSLLIGNTDEVIVDPTWQNAALNASRTRAGWTVAPGMVTKTAAGWDDFWLGAFSTYAPMPMRQGVRYKITATVRLTTAGNVGIYRRDDANAVGYVTNGQVPLAANTDYVVTAEYTWGASPGAFSIRMDQPGTIKDVSIRPMLSQVLIADGTILAPMIGAGQVKANNIEAGAVTALKLSADAINGKSVTGMLITGSTFQTTATAFRGIKIDGAANTLKVWDTSGGLTFSVNGATGETFQAGSFRTGLYFPNVEIRNNIWPGFIGMRFHAALGYGDINQADLKTNTDWWNGHSPGTMFLTSASHQEQGWSGRARGEIIVDPGHIYANLTGNDGAVDSWIKIQNRHQSDGAISIRGYGEVHIRSTNGRITLFDIPPAVGGNKIIMNQFFNIAYEASMRHLKRDIQEVAPTYELLDLPVSTFADAAVYDELGVDEKDDAPQYVGVIAEDVIELAAATESRALAALVHSVDQPGTLAPGEIGPTRAEQISTVDYDRLGALLLTVVADMNRRLTEMEGSNAA